MQLVFHKNRVRNFSPPSQYGILPIPHLTNMKKSSHPHPYNPYLLPHPQTRPNPTDAKKLELNQSQFIDKPLKALLAQIKPPIKFVYGNPENTWAGATGGTSLRLHFITKEERLKQWNKNQVPTEIVILFQLEPQNTRPPLPKEGLQQWTKENTKAYGDMIILKVRIREESKTTEKSKN